MPPDSVPAGRPRPPDSQSSLAIWKSRFDMKSVSRNPVIAVLDIEYNELTQAWKRLQEFLALENQVEFQERPQDYRDLSRVVRCVQDGWVSSPNQPTFTRCISLCDDFLSTVDPHSLLLATLPDCEFYLSLFYGAVQSIIKASASFPRIMEGLIKLLVEINKAIGLPSADELSFAKDGVATIAKFYALTFFFLGEFMDWYVRKATCRLLKTRSLDAYSDFQTVVCCIKGTARGMDIGRMDLDPECEGYRKAMKQNTSHLWEEARLSQVGLQGYTRRYASQNAMTRHLMWEMQHDATQRVRLKMESNLYLSQMISLANRQLLPVPGPDGGAACLLATQPHDLETSPAECAPTPKRKLGRVGLQLASQHLEDFFDSDDQISEIGPDVEVITEGSIVAALHEWTADPQSQILAVGGFPATDFLSSAAQISRSYASFARRAKVPVISHFCSLRPRAARGMTAFQEALVALVYSLIRQLIDYLPPVLGCCVSCDFGADRFSLLDGTLANWKEVLSLIDILLRYSPPLMVCVIDGLDVLEDVSTKVYIQSLLRIFLVHVGRQSVPMPDGNHLLKVLFTVTGRPERLVERPRDLTGEANRKETC